MRADGPDRPPADDADQPPLVRPVPPPRAGVARAGDAAVLPLGSATAGLPPPISQSGRPPGNSCRSQSGMAGDTRVMTLVGTPCSALMPSRRLQGLPASCVQMSLEMRFASSASMAACIGTSTVSCAPPRVPLPPAAGDAATLPEPAAAAAPPALVAASSPAAAAVADGYSVEAGV